MHQDSGALEVPVQGVQDPFQGDTEAYLCGLWQQVHTGQVWHSSGTQVLCSQQLRCWVLICEGPRSSCSSLCPWRTHKAGGPLIIELCGMGKGWRMKCVLPFSLWPASFVISIGIFSFLIEPTHAPTAISVFGLLLNGCFFWGRVGGKAEWDLLVPHLAEVCDIDLIYDLGWSGGGQGESNSRGIHFILLTIGSLHKNQETHMKALPAVL